MVVVSDKYKLNSIPFNSETAIIVTSYNGHLMFLKQTLINYMKSNAYVICSYDSNGQYPPTDVMDIPHSFVFKHRTYGAEKRNGWLWDIIYGAGVINSLDNIKYVFCVNSDCIWDKPSGLKDIIDLLGDADLMASSINSTIHTCSMIFKVDIFKSFVNAITEKLRDIIPESFSPEAVIRDWALENNIKKKIPPVQAVYPKGHIYGGKVDHYSSYNQDSTWKKLLGFRNLGGEHKWSCLEHLEPVPTKYFDLRRIGKFLSQHEKTTLYNYYVTNDRRWLYMYWDQGEDSWYNRKYFDLDHYGPDPLHDDMRRPMKGPDSERKKIFNRFNLDFENRE
jgi:hypothetical protein